MKNTSKKVVLLTALGLFLVIGFIDIVVFSVTREPTEITIDEYLTKNPPPTKRPEFNEDDPNNVQAVMRVRMEQEKKYQ
jgi:hypothetical protein